MVKKQLSFIFLILISFHAQAMLVKPANIETLTKEGHQIIHGEILKVTSNPGKNGRPAYLEVVVQVQETLKGSSQQVYTFRQPTSLNRQRPGFFGDLPKYRMGEEMVLFLTQPSDIGLSSPVGAQYGVFRVVKRNAKVVIVKSDARNGHLFENVQSAAIRNISKTIGAELTLSDLKVIIREAMKVQK